MSVPKSDFEMFLSNKIHTGPCSSLPQGPCGALKGNVKSDQCRWDRDTKTCITVATGDMKHAFETVSESPMTSITNKTYEKYLFS